MEFSAVYRTVACFGAYAEADAARGQLAAEGIVAAIRDPGPAAANTRAADAREAIRLLVLAQELERARQILALEPLDEPAPVPDRPAPRQSVRAEVLIAVLWGAVLLALIGLLATR